MARSPDKAGLAGPSCSGRGTWHRCFQSLVLALSALTLGVVIAAPQEVPTVAPAILYFPNANTRPFRSFSHHGHWMASTLHQIAPEVEIYALSTYSSDELEKVDAMVRAIDWAIAHGFDVLTCSPARFSPGESRNCKPKSRERGGFL